jgi:hypothetical protein
MILWVLNRKRHSDAIAATPKATSMWRHLCYGEGGVTKA